MTENKQLKFFSKQEKTFFRLDKDIEKLSRDRISFYAIRASLLILIMFLLLTGLYYQSLPINIPFFYSRPWGHEQLINKKMLFVFWGILFLFTNTNLIIASRIKTNNPLISKMFIWTSFILNLMALVSIFKIFFILSIW